MSGRDRYRRRLGGLFVALLAFAGRAAAHSGHDTHAGAAGARTAALAAALVVGSLLVLGTSVYLDRSGELGGRWADFGVLLGVAGLLAGMALALV